MSKIKRPSDEIIEFIRENYSYDESGLINSKIKNDIGERHKRLDGKVIIRLKVRGKNIRRAHIVWFLNRGVWPIQEIDHFDRNQLNDKIDNLREVTSDEQQQNKSNYMGYKGFSVLEKKDKPRTKKWQVRKQSQNIYLGYYLTEDEAKAAIDEYHFMRGEDWLWV